MNSCQLLAKGAWQHRLVTPSGEPRLGQKGREQTKRLGGMSVHKTVI